MYIRKYFLCRFGHFFFAFDFFSIINKMKKFVTFEEKIANTIIKSEIHDVESRKRTRKFNEIPGYTIISNRIYKTSDYKWDEEDWSNYHYWLKKFTQAGKLERRKFLIMAAWNQAKGRPPPSGVLL